MQSVSFVALPEIEKYPALHLQPPVSLYATLLSVLLGQGSH